MLAIKYCKYIGIAKSKSERLQLPTFYRKDKFLQNSCRKIWTSEIGYVLADMDDQGSRSNLYRHQHTLPRGATSHRYLYTTVYLPTCIDISLRDMLT